MPLTDPQREEIARLHALGHPPWEILALVSTITSPINKNILAGHMKRAGLSGQRPQDRKPLTPQQRIYNNERRRRLRAKRKAEGVASVKEPAEPKAWSHKLPNLTYLERAEGDEGILLMDLTRTQCRFPMDDLYAGTLTTRFCGLTTWGEGSYCQAHRRVVYQPAQARRVR